MTTTDARLYKLLDQHIINTTGGYEISPEAWAHAGHRISSPVEPCDRCEGRVFLLLAAGWSKPAWFQLGSLEGTDTLFPQIRTKRHMCGDGDSWSVEAALFVESAMLEWSHEDQRC